MPFALLRLLSPRRCVVLTAVTLFLILSPLPAATDSGPERTDLFVPGQDGIAFYRIPGMIVSTRGAVLAYAEARKKDRADWGEIEIHLRRSTDGGKTWEPARQIAHFGPRLEGNPHKPQGGEHEQTVNNPVAIADADGTVYFLYCVNYSHCFCLRSEDDGRTFSPPVEITAAFAPFHAVTLATGPGHGIQLRNGRLLVPIWVNHAGIGAKAQHEAGTIYSDDHGRTWHAGVIAVPNTPAYVQPNECCVAQLSDGRVLLNVRNNSKAGRRLITISADGADGWSEPKFDEALWEPGCMAGLTTVPGHPGLLLFSNPMNLKRDAAGQVVTGVSAPRRNVSVRLSSDDGRTWPVVRVLEPGSSGYSDLGALADGTVFCFFERGRSLTIARFSLRWLAAGPPP